MDVSSETLRGVLQLFDIADLAGPVEEQVARVSEGLWKVVIRAGKSSVKPAIDTKIKVQYRACIEGAKTVRKAPKGCIFVLGKRKNIRGWTEGILSMTEGETSLLVCSPASAYGAKGVPPFIPPNSTLYFMIELVSCQYGKFAATGAVQKDVPNAEPRMIPPAATNLCKDGQTTEHLDKTNVSFPETANQRAKYLTSTGGITKRVVQTSCNQQKAQLGEKAKIIVTGLLSAAEPLEKQQLAPCVASGDVHEEGLNAHEAYCDAFEADVAAEVRKMKEDHGYDPTPSPSLFESKIRQRPPYTVPAIKGRLLTHTSQGWTMAKPFGYSSRYGAKLQQQMQSQQQQEIQLEHPSPSNLASIFTAYDEVARFDPWAELDSLSLPVNEGALPHAAEELKISEEHVEQTRVAFMIEPFKEKSDSGYAVIATPTMTTRDPPLPPSAGVAADRPCSGTAEAPKAVALAETPTETELHATVKVGAEGIQQLLEDVFCVGGDVTGQPSTTLFELADIPGHQAFASFLNTNK